MAWATTTMEELAVVAVAVVVDLLSEDSVQHKIQMALESNEYCAPWSLSKVWCGVHSDQ